MIMGTQLAEADLPRRTLAECETVIERALASFVDVGEALNEINESELYRQQFTTFEDYCQQRWGFVARRAYQLIKAAQIAQLVRKRFHTSLPNDGVARELLPLKSDPELLDATWKALKAFTPAPTVLQVREVVRRVKAAPADEPDAVVVRQAIAMLPQAPITGKPSRRNAAPEPARQEDDLEPFEFFDFLTWLTDAPAPRDLLEQVPQHSWDRLRPIDEAIRYLMTVRRLWQKRVECGAP
jgi:hypothetical protein